MAVRENARRSIMRPSRQQGSCQPRRPHVALTLRLPPELHARVQAALERERRTLTQQVIYLLEPWVEEQERGGAGEC
jgi:hypothetical protein